MTVKHVEGWSERTGSEYWGGDRLHRMVETKDLEKESNPLCLLKHIPLNLSQVRVADIGSGIGRRHIYFPGAEYVGFDREECMIKGGREHFPHLTFVHCDVQELLDKNPQYKEYFDVCTTFHVLQYNHVDQQDEILPHIFNCLRPGGFFYMKENTVPGDSIESENGYSYTQKGWIRKVERFGFQFVTSDENNGHFLFMRPVLREKIIRRFKDIYIAPTSRFMSGWPLTIQELAEFARSYIDSNFQMRVTAQQAQKFYSWNTEYRIGRFLRTIRSIHDRGFLCQMTVDNPPTLDFASMPRILVKDGDLLLDDGRHRAAALIALGVKHLPVVEVTFHKEKVTEQQLEDSLNVLGQDIVEACAKFKSPQEWLQYTQTPDFNIIRPKEM